MNRPARFPTFWAWSALGLAGSVLAAVAAPAAVPDSTTPWWYAASIPGGRGVATTLIYVGKRAGEPSMSQAEIDALLL